MKRFRLLGFDFDARADMFDSIQEEWEANVKAMHRINREQTLQELRREYGEHAFDKKVENFVALGNKPFSVIAFHNRFFTQAREAFVACHYYPALTGVVALGERVLNHLVLGLRDQYKASSVYRRIHRKSSFDNWELAIEALREWDVLTSEAEVHFRNLWMRRNEALHFNLKTELNDRALALEALLLFSKIVEAQFSCFGSHPWLFTPPGEVYIRKDWEKSPFVQLVYLPNALYVGYKHMVVSVFPWRIEDKDAYEPRDVTDEEFTELRVQSQGALGH